MPKMWVIVQHSGFGYSGDPTFEAGLETREVAHKTTQKALEKRGALLFDNYIDAENFCEDAMYPDGYEGLIPQAKGEFSHIKIDGLAVYLPVREVKVIG